MKKQPTSSSKRKRTVIDPPSGWMYGFPAKVPIGMNLGDHEALTAWVKSRGYPQTLIDQGMLKHCRWWEVDEYVEEGPDVECTGEVHPPGD